MKKITYGTPEAFTPTAFCKNLSYTETPIHYPVEEIRFKCTPRGCVLVLPIHANEQIYGLGLQLKAFGLRGRKMVTRPNADPIAATGDSHAPVPFFVSTAGYGIYVDTARYAEFYMGSSYFLAQKLEVPEKKEIAISTEELYRPRDVGEAYISIQIPAAKGVDIYIIEGKNITDVVAQYNMFSGGGCDVPEWALSPIYRCNSRYNQQQVLESAKKMRDNGMDVGIIGLEPGWQSKTYSCSYVWNDDLYPDPQGLVDKLKAMDYHVNLWEHAFVHPTSPLYENMIPYSGDYVVWCGCVPDFSLEPAQELFAQHHKKLIDMGIDGFKLDECDSSDYTGGWSFPNLAEFPSGMDGEQYHSMIGVLYMQTMLKALGKTPTLSEVRNAGALSASYPFVLYSDLYDHRDFVRGCATAGFSGLLWTPEVRDAATKEEFIRRLQSNVFSVQCLINAWYCETFPWEPFACEKEVKELFEVRKGLIPMLKKAFEKYKKTGIPPVRALVSDYTDDRETYSIDDQYIFCDTLIVAPMIVGETSRKVYLPKGEWRDYFTKEAVSSGWFTVETDSIPVYEKIED